MILTGITRPAAEAGPVDWFADDFGTHTHVGLELDSEAGR